MPLYLSEPNMLPTAYDGAVSVDFQLLTRTYLGRGLDAIGAAQTCDGGMVTRGYLAQRIAFFDRHRARRCPGRMLGTRRSRSLGAIGTAHGVVRASILGIGCGREVTCILICILIEDIRIRMGCLVSKVKDTCRINCITHISGFEMQVRSGRTTGITTKCYGITGVYILLGLDKET